MPSTIVNITNINEGSINTIINSGLPFELALPRAPWIVARFWYVVQRFAPSLLLTEGSIERQSPH
jgi:hypothetical protein